MLSRSSRLLESASAEKHVVFLIDAMSICRDFPDAVKLLPDAAPLASAWRNSSLAAAATVCSKSYCASSSRPAFQLRRGPIAVREEPGRPGPSSALCNASWLSHAFQQALVAAAASNPYRARRSWKWPLLRCEVRGTIIGDNARSNPLERGRLAVLSAWRSRRQDHFQANFTQFGGQIVELSLLDLQMRTGVLRLKTR